MTWRQDPQNVRLVQPKDSFKSVILTTNNKYVYYIKEPECCFVLAHIILA